MKSERARGGYGRLGQGYSDHSFCISAPHNDLYVSHYHRHREPNLYSFCLIAHLLSLLLSVIFHSVYLFSLSFLLSVLNRSPKERLNAHDGYPSKSFFSSTLTLVYLCKPIKTVKRKGYKQTCTV